MANDICVFVVDDDFAIRDAMRGLLEALEFEVETFESAKAFLGSNPRTRRGCLIADIAMPDMDGLALQRELIDLRCALPVIMITGHGDVPLAVRAMKAGAVDFLEKPVEVGRLVESIKNALEHDSQNGSVAPARIAENRLALLTERERQVLELLVEGRANKIIAYELSISPRTVEIHRARLMRKMGVRHLAALVRMAFQAKIAPPQV